MGLGVASAETQLNFAESALKTEKNTEAYPSHFFNKV
jgi:hypothetical protein